MEDRSTPFTILPLKFHSANASCFTYTRGGTPSDLPQRLNSCDALSTSFHRCTQFVQHILAKRPSVGLEENKNEHTFHDLSFIFFVYFFCLHLGRYAESRDAFAFFSQMTLKVFLFASNIYEVHATVDILDVFFAYFFSVCILADIGMRERHVLFFTKDVERSFFSQAIYMQFTKR